MTIRNKTTANIYVRNKVKFSLKQKRTCTVKPNQSVELLEFPLSLVKINSKYGMCIISNVYDIYYTKSYGKIKVKIRDEEFHIY